MRIATDIKILIKKCPRSRRGPDKWPNGVSQGVDAYIIAFFLRDIKGNLWENQPLF